MFKEAFKTRWAKIRIYFLAKASATYPNWFAEEKEKHRKNLKYQARYYS